ncbi:uncharacterized protein LOC118459997 isoform X2 [Anopheles albimanus]|uniref:uncharacterized protein LOC118459997 isoform X2 n=1 Tax=Anopheles albimanus TaxID=7167 RepID=UPI00163F6380|nr:uncharacterized protein LOC118459997 isoform X2 [Anopheles albimanus]
MMDRSRVGLRSRSFRPTMVLSLILLLGFNAVSLTNAFIVPEELPSILSLVYSNIPPIKKGTDSRIGFGFRLGEHADFQVQLELGPQLNTRPIGQAAGSSKRYVDNDDYANSVRNPPRSSSWLEAWSKQTKQRQQFNKDKLRDSLMPPAPIMNEGAYNQLQQLYEMNKQREYEDAIGTLPAEVLETRINQLKALHNPVNQFKPMPSETNEAKSLSQANAPRAAEPTADSSAHVIVVTASPPEPEEGTTTASVASSTTTVAATPAATVDVARRNVRRRTNRPTSPRDKERITAQLSDVSLD